MTAPTDPGSSNGVGPTDAAREPPVEDTACYVFGVVPSGTRLPEDLAGLDGGPVRLVEHRGVAAVVGGIVSRGPLGARDELLAHEEVVAAAAEASVVLPFPFGAVVTAADAVADQLLAPNHGWYADVLADLRGRREFVVTGEYDADALLREIMAERPEITDLRAAIGDRPVEASYPERIQLGDAVVRALDDKRAADTDELVGVLEPYAVAVALRESAGDAAAADAAFLVPDEERPAFEDAVDRLAARWTGRVALRLSGPLAPYDFVPFPEEV
ncbi:GvpL/GvpF family gas vesicle protein [Actinocorallia sp. A-T 12471]|uniref:GvpL/GvpF family gas vesicle protein n=1 Tax=Actinocorallia sp. A-T 12471 TaxID=3089813 RepID=UPI0029CC9694|nr:GvpL/GvpF family gas vesicle protein [Actinocorallia sp. A-T 12471]MDX6742192.1 GvpL/GvpF family gas vesicle protein [Actinocorallia sp. A-T 12471]